MSRGYRLSFIAVLSGALQFVSALCSGRNAGEGFAGTWFRLMNNIDLNGHPWTPVGTGPATDGSPSFYGTFDGDGNRVAGLFISHATGLSGLFSFIGQKGCVQNLHVTVPQIISCTGSDTGAIAGWNNGTIRHCVTSGNGIVQGIWAGGITGTNMNRLTNCFSTLAVSGETCGGIPRTRPTHWPTATPLGRSPPMWKPAGLPPTTI